MNTVLSVKMIDGTFRLTYHSTPSSLSAEIAIAAGCLERGTILGFAAEHDQLINLNYEVARHSFNIVARRDNGIERRICVAANTRAIAASLVKKAGFASICSVNMIG